MSVGSIAVQTPLLVAQNHGNLRLLLYLDNPRPYYCFYCFKKLRSNHPKSASFRLQIVGITSFNTCAATSKLASASTKSATTFQRLDQKSCSHMVRLHHRQHPSWSLKKVLFYDILPMSVGSIAVQTPLLVAQNHGNLRLLLYLDNPRPYYCFYCFKKLRSNHPKSASFRLQIVGITSFNTCAATSKLASASTKSATTFQRLDQKSCSHMVRLHCLDAVEIVGFYPMQRVVSIP